MRRVTPTLACVVGSLSVCFVRPAHAGQPDAPDVAPLQAPEPAPEPVDPKLTPDRVEQSDGVVLRGIVTSKQPGKIVIIRLPDGTRRLLPWDRVAAVDVAPRATGTIDCALVPEDRACAKQQRKEARRKRLAERQAAKEKALRDQNERERAAAEKQARLVEQRRNSAKPPGNGLFALSFALDAGLGAADVSRPGFVQSGEPIGTFGPRAGAVAAYGGRMPGVDGGKWFGFGGDARGGIACGALGTDDQNGIRVLYIGGSLGIQFLAFGPLNLVKMRQQLFGFFGGYHLGYRGVSAQLTHPDCNPDCSTFTDHDFAGLRHGPVLRLMFGRRNALTGGIFGAVVEGSFTFHDLDGLEAKVFTLGGGLLFSL